MDLLAVSQVAKRLGMCRETVVRLIGSGDLRASRIGRQWRVSERDLQDFIDRAANKPPRDGTAA